MDINQISNEHARKTLEHILNSNEFTQSRISESLQDSLRHLFANFDGQHSIGAAQAMLTATEILIGVAGVILTVYFCRNFGPIGKLLVSQAKVKDTADIVEVRSTAVELLEQADQMAKTGEFRIALQRLYLSALLELDNRQLIMYKAAKTNSEYFQEISQRASVIKELFYSMVTLFEYKWYGLERCTSEDFQKGRELYYAMLKRDAHD